MQTTKIVRIPMNEGQQQPEMEAYRGGKIKLDKLQKAAAPSQGQGQGQGQGGQQ